VSLAPVARCGIQRQGEGHRLGREDPRSDGGCRATPEAVGVGAAAHQEPPSRPAFTVLPRRWVIERPFFVAFSEQEDEEGIREAMCHQRGFRLRGDESPDDEEVGSLIRRFRQFLRKSFDYAAASRRVASPSAAMQ
jgi:hypothetical protein